MKKLRLSFFVDLDKLLYFSKLLEKDADQESATKELLRIKELWEGKQIFFEKLFLEKFPDIVIDKVKVFVFPPDYLLGATETKERIILFGQPSRTRHFPLAILAHEICHIFLSEYKIMRTQMVDEVICYMIEDYVYSIFDGKSLLEVWKKEELDDFHFNAMMIAINETKTKSLISDLNIEVTINSLFVGLDKAILDLKPPKGLLASILPKRCSG